MNFHLIPWKAKELYYTRCMECERCKKDGSSPKEVEKVSGNVYVL